MRILVTGGAGFIGSHVVDVYVDAGHRVAVIDNLATGSRRNLNPKAKFYRADILNQKLLERIFQKELPEIVNHHAALASVAASMKNPNKTLEVNVAGTANLLRAFGNTRNPKKFIFASTGGAMYGAAKKFPVPETVLPCPLSAYGLSKLLAEETVQFYSRYFDLDFTILRYANVYGPRQNPRGESGVVAIFSALMRKRGQPTIFGDGTKSRDYVYVGDIARANAAALTKGSGKTLNLGRGALVSDREVFDTVAQALRYQGKPRYAATRPGEVYKISLNAEKARRALRWHPRVSFTAGVHATLESTSKTLRARASGFSL